MSGQATPAYAFLIQALNVCQMMDGYLTGRVDIGNLSNRLKDVYGDSRSHVSDLPSDGVKETPLLNVVLAGWSWRRSKFEGYSYSYQDSGDLRFRRLSELDESRAYGVYFFGDAADEARGRLRRLIRERNFPIPKSGQLQDGDIPPQELARDAFLEWEPLEILLDIIKDSSFPSVGGTPQVLKMYQYGQSETFVWRDDAGQYYYGGRRVLSNERFDRRVLQWRDCSPLMSPPDPVDALYLETP